ncbi:MAG: transcriptional repressor [Bdellovibrionales bacterium]|nr:transcriptional repressor [Bdellovibrionales bacterium]
MPQTLPCGRRKPQHSPSSGGAKSAWRTTLGDYLKKEGLRSTTQREHVAEIALGKRTHFEIQVLIRDVQAKYPEISPATVYRSVSTLCDAGLLHETLESNSGVKLYEAADDEHHDHIVCMDCGEIFEFHDEGMEKSQDLATERMGFKPERHRHVIYARCEFKKR